MAELSSNWKKLQAKIKAESSTSQARKRKAGPEVQLSQKCTKISQKGFKTQGDTTKKSARRSVIKPPESNLTRKQEMGAVQSRLSDNIPKQSASASLSLWAADNDISPEDLAEAYDLGIPGNSMMKPTEKDKINSGLIEGIELGKYVSIDCEMVGVGPGGYESSLARVSIVDFHGRQVYDSYVKSQERVTNWRTSVSGISIKHMRFARNFADVQRQVDGILKDRILVGHDLKHDLEALMLSHPPRHTRDTAKYSAFRKYGNGRKPALRVLAKELLNMEIQDGAHSSIEDARATMLLFRKYKPGFDVDIANRYAPKNPSKSGHPGAKRSKAKRKT